MIGLFLAPEAAGGGLDFVDRKNEAIIGGIVWNCGVCVDLEEGGGAGEVGIVLLASVLLNGAEEFKGFVELA